MRSVVVLPAPFGPSRPVISPSRAVNDTPSTAFTAPNALWRFLTSIMAYSVQPSVDPRGHSERVVEPLPLSHKERGVQERVPCKRSRSWRGSIEIHERGHRP